MGVKMTWVGIAVLAIGIVLTTSWHIGVMTAGVIILVIGVAAIVMDK